MPGISYWEWNAELAGVFLKPIFNSGLVKLGPFVQGPPFLLYHYRLPLYIRYNNHRSVTL